MKLAVFFVSISSSFSVVCGLCGGDLTVSTPPPHSRFLACSSLLTAPPRECTAAKTGREGWHVGRKRKRGERHSRWMINAKKNKTGFTVRDSRRSFCQCFIAERQRTLTYAFNRSGRQELFYITFLSSWLIFPLLFFFFFFLIRDAVLKKAKTSSYELLLCTALSQQLLSFCTRDKPCNQKTTLISFWLFCFWLLLTCHV